MHVVKDVKAEKENSHSELTTQVQGVHLRERLTITLVCLSRSTVLVSIKHQFESPKKRAQGSALLCDSLPIYASHITSEAFIANFTDLLHPEQCSIPVADRTQAMLAWLNLWLPRVTPLCLQACD